MPGKELELITVLGKKKKKRFPVGGKRNCEPKAKVNLPLYFEISG